MASLIKYRSGYKHQLFEDYDIHIDIFPPVDIYTKYINLTTEGLLFIKLGYAWDGASGPTFDTPSSMRGSLVHDALYQLMRLGVLDYKVHRKRADEILREICLEDGMCSFRAWYVYQALHLFAEGSARPRKEPEVKIICVP